MQKGDRVIHKLTGQRGTVKSISETVATIIKDVPEPYTNHGEKFDGKIAVCAVNNLQAI